MTDRNDLNDLTEVHICKYCGSKYNWDDFIWLNGKCLCPDCYEKERKIVYGNS